MAGSTVSGCRGWITLLQNSVASIPTRHSKACSRTYSPPEPGHESISHGGTRSLNNIMYLRGRFLRMPDLRESYRVPYNLRRDGERHDSR